MTRLTDDDRAVSELLGAMLLFGLLISLLVIVQANAVPSANQGVEFEHNQQLQSDFQSFDADVDTVAATGRDRATVVTTGVSYPTRFILFNPGPVAGTLATTEADFSVSGAVATGETGDYWDGSTRTFDNSRLTYTARYNYYDAPATAYHAGVVYNRFESGARQVDAGAFVSGNTIDLVALAGTRATSQVSPTTLSVTPLSTETETVRVTSTASDPVVVTLSTELAASDWEGFLEDELAANGGSVADVRDGPGDSVEVEFAPGTYELTLAAVGIGEGAERSGPTYLTTPDSTPATGAGEATELAVEVRDAFNAEEPGVEVSFSTSDGTLSTAAATTGDDGRATVRFTPEPGTRTATVVAAADLDGDGTVRADERVTFTVAVSGGDGASDVNPAGGGTVRQTDASAVACTEPTIDGGSVPLTDDDCRVLVGFENLASESRTVQGARVSFYNPESYDTGQGTEGRRRPAPETVRLGGTDLDVGGGFEDVSLDAIAPDETERFEFRFSVPEGRYNTVTGDFFVVTFQYTNGDTATYFVAPQGVGSEPGPDDEGPDIEFRVDDLTHANENRVEYVGSYDVSGANASFQRVEIRYENRNNGAASETLTAGDERGSLTYTQSYGSGATYDISLRVIYETAGGVEYVAEERTLTDVANAVNPGGNADLSESGSAALASSAIQDNTNDAQGPRYRFDYQVTSGSYTETRLVAVSTGNGGKAAVTRTERSGANVRLVPGYGTDEPFRLVLLVFDADGAVVDTRVVTDTADGTDP